MSRDRATWRPRVLWLTVILAPLLLAAVAALAVALTHTNWVIHTTTPLTTLLLVLGAGLSLLIGGTLAIRRVLTSRHAIGYAAGAAVESEAHRRFIARLDHELKNPVTAIRAALEASVDESPGLRVAAGQADRLAALIGELRSLSALETAELERGPVDTAAVVADEVAAFIEEQQALGESREIDLHLPSAPWPLPRVAGDADLIAVAVRNLLVNAAKYSDPGSRIEIRGTEDAGHVVLEIADTGWGITSEELEHVWDELWRGSEARRVEGTGLGLSLVRLVARRHGGEVSVRSIPGTGTSVRVYLPAL
ncbi:HAMP domain-containing histidine kinase [Leucobacter insecticola]|uniref:Sensor-like histidine kinase SenX3 n=1 Tax=Leucobacter insecticola TaxID=2714934 RepID=A0A6G8FL77_9MICO|nr:HAMP domain-containing sensor histidine kinase [Leucobacter insecticola]QIM17186.1 HAMP domain-containing histidine kinase [Leucobacter insecticola]